MNWRRKKSFVSPREQVWFGLEMVMLGIGFVLILAFFMFMSPMSDAFSDDPTRLLDELMGFVYRRWWLVTLSMAVFFFIGVLMSHRLYGPMFGIRSVLQRWMAGERGARLRLRKFDYLLPLMNPMNELLDRQQKIDAHARALSQKLAQHADAEIQKEAHDLLEALDA